MVEMHVLAHFPSRLAPRLLLLPPFLAGMFLSLVILTYSPSCLTPRLSFPLPSLPSLILRLPSLSSLDLSSPLCLLRLHLCLGERLEGGLQLGRQRST